MRIDQRLNALLDTDELEVAIHRFRIEALARFADHLCRTVTSKDPFRHTRPLIEKTASIGVGSCPFSELNAAVRDRVWAPARNLTIDCVALLCKSWASTSHPCVIRCDIR